MISRETDFFARLTHRQREVLTLLAQRLSNSKIAQLLDFAEATTRIDMASLRMRFRHWPRPPSPTNEQADSPSSMNETGGPASEPVIAKDHPKAALPVLGRSGGAVPRRRFPWVLAQRD